MQSFQRFKNPCMHYLLLSNPFYPIDVRNKQGRDVAALFLVPIADPV